MSYKPVEPLGVLVDPVPGKVDRSGPICFIHIPRTGGSTVKEMMRSTLGVGAALIDAHYYRPMPEILREFEFVEGHIGSKFFEQVLGQGWHANTHALLRDPVARAVSQARHIRARPGRYHSELAAAVRDPHGLFEKVPVLQNHQTKLLSGSLLETRALDRGVLVIAKANLEQMSFGMTEDFDVSMALFTERLGLRVARYGVSNNSPDRGDEDLRSAAFREAAKLHNGLDCELFEYALGLFRDRVARHVDALSALDFVDTQMECAMFLDGAPIGSEMRVPAGRPTVRLAGWVLIDGLAADSALIDIAGVRTPLASRIARPDAARHSRDPRNRHAGILGHIAVPEEAEWIELIAFERTRGLRARWRVPIVLDRATRPKRGRWNRSRPTQGSDPQAGDA